MKHFIKRIGLAATVIGALAPAAMADSIFDYSFPDKATFESQFTIADNNNDGVKWVYYKYTTGSTPYSYARLYSYSCHSYNDALTSVQAYHLEPGHAYCLEIEYFSDNSGSFFDPADGTLSVGYLSDPADMNNVTLIAALHPDYINKYQGDAVPTERRYFEVSAAGDYYFTFLCMGSNGACISRAELSDAGSPTTPMEVTGLTVTPASDFSLQATISGTLPDKTITGSALPSITKVEVYRGETLAGSVTSGLTPGGTFSWTDTSAGAGEQSYTVYVCAGEERSEGVTGSAYVGPLKPLAPSSVTADKVADTPNSYYISWIAPLRSDNNILLDTSLLKYDVYRVVDGAESLIASDLTETNYTDSYISATRVSLSYKVTAKYGTMTSEGSTSTALRIGRGALPFYESFAGRTPGDMEPVKVEGEKNWESVSSCSHPYATPQDGDGGMAMYNSYSASRGSSARLITPVFDSSTVTNLVLEYWMYHHTSGADQLYVEVEKDGSGEWTMVEGSEVTVQGSPANWTRHVVALTDAVAGSSTFRVSMTALSAFGYDIVIDNLALYNRNADDLSVKSVTGPESVVAGNEATYTVTVANFASNARTAADYTVSVYVDDALAATLDGVDIASDATADFSFTRMMTAADKGSVSVKAVVNFAGDEDTTNNEGVAATDVTTVSLLGVTDPRGVQDGDNIVLTWEAPFDASAYEAFTNEYDFANAVDNDEHILDGWKALDLDNGDVTDRYKWKSTIFKVFDPSDSYAPRPTTGKCIAVTVPDAVNANDWLISPEISCFEGATMKATFSMRLMDRIKFDICYSTTDDAPESFQVAASFNGDQNSSFSPFVAEVPGSAKYIGLHVNSEAKRMALLILDKVTVESQLDVYTGFNVYEEGERLNDELITGTSYTVAAAPATRAAETQRTFNIATEYESGETDMSEPVVVTITTGVKGIENSFGGITVLDGAVRSEAAMEVYNVNGMRVASTSGAATVSLDKGVYIVRSAGNAVKVIVK